MSVILALNVTDSSSDDDSSIMEDDSSRSSSVTPRPLAVGAGAGSHHSRGSVESHGPIAAPRSAQSHSASGGKVSHGGVAARGATPPSASSRDVDATPPSSRPSCACSVSTFVLASF